MYRHKRGGFTLVELLVVVAIIGILSTIVMVSLSKARGKARDATRREALKTLASGLEAYRAENSSGFPPSTSSDWVSSTGDPNYIPGMVPGYVAALPQDSGPDCTTAIGNPASVTRAYWYKSDTTGFKILACAENTVDATDAMYDPVRAGYTLTVCHGSSTFDCAAI